jgi:hypothetical protein
VKHLSVAKDDTHAEHEQLTLPQGACYPALIGLCDMLLNNRQPNGSLSNENK